MSDAVRKTKFIMVQGTMSNAGKSLVVAGLCRVLRQDGYKVCPFKSQNMALNSYITEEGLEMGRAQVMQAEAAGVRPLVNMNPILLKPTDDVGSQVIVGGKVLGNMKARDYFEYKKQLVPEIMKAVNELSQEYEVIVIEGAGSPAEINLKDNDIVNMGMAELVDAPVLLVGDIDRGGVFAQLYGTLELLTADERARVRGLVINKFRGDKSILDPGIEMIEEKGGVPVVGVLPYMDISLEDEDSLSERFEANEPGGRGYGLIDIAVIRLPHISNFTDFNVFDEFSQASVRFVKSRRELGNPDLLVIPGSKSTISDMKWLREKGLDAAICKLAAADTPVMGICGGFQMLGEMISDPDEVEGGGSVAGLSILPVETIIPGDTVRSLTAGEITGATGVLSGLEGMKYSGYEIHMGRTLETGRSNARELTDKGSGICLGNIYGTYIHGIFDEEGIAAAVLKGLADKKGIALDATEAVSFKDFKEQQYDALADMIREYMDLEKVYEIMGIEH